jgi:CheY-like chemotaxis protein
MTSGGRRIGWRRFSGEPLEIGQATLDEWPDRFLEARFACELEGLLVAPAHLLGSDALLQPVVAGDEEFLDLLTNVLRRHKSHHNVRKFILFFMETAAALPSEIGVLVADDEPLFVEMLQAMLAAEDGIDVVATVGDGRAAVRLATELEPDVILMDVSMPIMDGIDATARIRERDPNACILILTGGTTPGDVDRARKAGAAAYITKDRISTDLIDEIRTLGSK